MGIIKVRTTMELNFGKKNVFEQYVLKATIILILEILDVVLNLHIGNDNCGCFGTF